ncbi:uncharacterized protein METZ01_LOCUS239436, partial [marine metagenome]
MNPGDELFVAAIYALNLDSDNRCSKCVHSKL